MVRTIDGIPRPIGGDKPPKGNKAVAGAAVAIVLAAVAGGGAGSAAAGGGAAEEFSPGARTSQSQEAARSSRGQTEVRIKGSDDGLKATLHLRQLGQHHVTFEAAPTSHDCASYSDGEIRRFLNGHKCVSLNRTFVGIGEKDYEIWFSIATIEMPNYGTAADLHALLLRDGTGDFTPFFPKEGKYRHIPVTVTPSKTTLHDDTVINIQGQGVGRTPGAAVVASLATSVLFSLDTS